MDDCLDDDFFVNLAHDGTIEGTTADLDLGTRCLEGALQLDDTKHSELLRDCALANSPLITQDTFWIGAAAAPRCALEALALAVFERHCGASPFARAARSGAEWWVQVKDPTADADDAKQVCFHWDKDERAHALHGFYVFPQLSTVTYLTDGGAPTVVLDRRPDSFTGAISDEPIGEGAACYPARGNHLCFDGRKLHGAPLDLRRSPAAERRVTFLVNCWLDHRPSGVREFPAAALGKMSRPGLAAFRTGAAAARPAEAARGAGDARELVYPFSRVGTRHAVRLTMVDFDPASTAPLVDLFACGCAARVGEEDEPPRRRELEVPAPDAPAEPPAKRRKQHN